MALRQIRIRRSTTTEWETYNTVLAQGEPGLDTTLGVLKIGDGTSGWSALPVYAVARALSTDWTDVIKNVSAISSETPVNNSATLVTSSSLNLDVDARGTYLFKAEIYYDSTQDLKMGWAVPSGSNGSWTPDAPSATASAANSVTIDRSLLDIAATGVAGGVGVGIPLVAKPSGIVIVGDTPGEIAFQYAQQSAAASDTTLRAGSSLSLTRIV